MTAETAMIPYEPAFPAAEHESRVARIQEVMGRRGLDGLVLTREPDVYYVSGFDTENHGDPQLVVIPHQGRPTLIALAFERGRVANTAWMSDVAYYERRSQAVGVVSDVLRSAGLDRGAMLGIEQGSGTLSPTELRALLGQLPRAVVRDTDSTMSRVRLRKSPRELSYMREAGRISVAAIEAGGAAIAAGEPDTAVAAAIVASLYLGGSDVVCWGPVVAAGYRAGAPHCTFNGRRIEHGDTVFLELTAQRRRYAAPVMGTWSVGPPRADLERIAEAGATAIEVICERATAGVTASEVTRVVEERLLPILDRHGLYMPDRYGYSVGIGFPPTWDEDLGFVIDRVNDMPFEAGMTFHLPISLRRYGEFGVNQSRTIVITEGRAEILTRAPASLAVGIV